MQYSETGTSPPYHGCDKIIYRGNRSYETSPPYAYTMDVIKCSQFFKVAHKIINWSTTHSLMSAKSMHRVFFGRMKIYSF